MAASAAWPSCGWRCARATTARVRSTRRRGFAEVGLRRGYYPAAGRREDAVVMRLALTEGGLDVLD